MLSKYLTRVWWSGSLRKLLVTAMLECIESNESQVPYQNFPADWGGRGGGGGGGMKTIKYSESKDMFSYSQYLHFKS